VMEKTLMHRTGYYVVFERDEDGWYVVHVPELPGCISQGSNFHDASLNITNAINDYLELVEQSPTDRSMVTTSGDEMLESFTVESARFSSEPR
jgi:predicted RNase H-like HicB family nuclease